MLDEPLDLLFYHLFLRQKHVLQDLHQLRLQLGVADPLPHLHDLDDGLLERKEKEMLELCVDQGWTTFHLEGRTDLSLDYTLLLLLTCC